MEIGLRVAPYSNSLIVGTVIASVTGTPYNTVNIQFEDHIARFFVNAFLLECIVQPDGELLRDKILRSMGLKHGPVSEKDRKRALVHLKAVASDTIRCAFCGWTGTTAQAWEAGKSIVVPEDDYEEHNVFPCPRCQRQGLEVWRNEMRVSEFPEL